MTADERLNRIEHVTAALAEERCKDREEYKALWRQTQENLDRLTAQVDRNAQQIAALGQKMDQLAVQAERDRATARAAEVELRDRLQSLVSAMGEYIRQDRERR